MIILIKCVLNIFAISCDKFQSEIYFPEICVIIILVNITVSFHSIVKCLFSIFNLRMCKYSKNTSGDFVVVK